MLDEAADALTQKSLYKVSLLKERRNSSSGSKRASPSISARKCTRVGAGSMLSAGSEAEAFDE